MLDYSKFKNSRRGERGFVIGTAPSIEKLDLSLMDNDVTIGVNTLWPIYESKYFMINDDVLIRSLADALTQDAFLGDIRVPIFTILDPLSWFGMAGLSDNEVDLVPLFRHQGGMGCAQEHGEVPLFSNGFNVCYVALQVLYYMGCDPIYLLGQDFLWDPQGFTPHAGHSTRIIDSLKLDTKKCGYPHFDPIMGQYGSAQKRATLDHRGIFNASPVGHLEIFPRVCYEGLFNDD